METPFGVSRIERIGDLDGQRQQSFHLQRTPPDPLPQCHPIQKLHGDESSSVVFADFVDRADVGMIQCRRRPRLSPKALQSRRFPRCVFGKELQCRQPPEQSVPSFVDNSHPTAAQWAQHAVVRDSGR